MFGIGFWEFVLITVLLLLVLGPEKIGPIMKTLGRAMREIQKGVGQMRQELKIDDDLKDIDEIQRNIVHDARIDDDSVEKLSTKELAKKTGKSAAQRGDRRPWDKLHDMDDVDVEVVAGTDAEKNEKQDE